MFFTNKLFFKSKIKLFLKNKIKLLLASKLLFVKN